MQKSSILYNNVIHNKTLAPKSKLTYNGININTKLYNIRGSNFINNNNIILKEDAIIQNRDNFILECKPTKASEFRDMTFEEIDAAVGECKKELYFLRAKQATRQEYKSHMFKFYKRKVAQLLTVRREKEIDMGINKRKSRKLEIKRKLESGEL